MIRDPGRARHHGRVDFDFVDGNVSIRHFDANTGCLDGAAGFGNIEAVAQMGHEHGRQR
jgi:hypothetical protein